MILNYISFKYNFKGSFGKEKLLTSKSFELAGPFSSLLLHSGGEI